MIISIDLDRKPYLRYLNFALTSITSSNLGCDKFPSEFSKIRLPLKETAFVLVKCSFLRGRIIYLKTCLGPYRSLFVIEKSNAARKFSIEDRVDVARPKKSFKVGENMSVENRKSIVLKKCVFFGRKKVVFFLVPPDGYRFSGLLWNARDRFYDKNNGFHEKNPEYGNFE